MIKLNRVFRNIGLSVALLSSSYASAADITGAGATFSYPVYSRWADAYKAEKGTGVNYQPFGSSNGIKQIQSSTVDFAATDAPLSESELESLGLTQFPVVIGGVVPVVNINGIGPGKLKLNGTVLAEIFLGNIRKWNDQRIVADNADVALPDEPITVILRSDGSDTTFLLTSYLSQVSPEWKRIAGVGKNVYWPAGTGGKGNEAVAAYVQRIGNSIGYVEYTYAVNNKLAFTQMKNRDGQFVMPAYASFNAAANAHSNSGKGFHEILPNEPGKDSWPITGTTFIVVYKSQQKTGECRKCAGIFRLGVHPRRQTGFRTGLCAATGQPEDANPRLLEDTNQGLRQSSLEIGQVNAEIYAKNSSCTQPISLWQA